MTLPPGWPEKGIHTWTAPQDIGQTAFRCPYCSRDVGSYLGYQTTMHGNRSPIFKVYLCGYCSGATFFDHEGRQWPGARPGEAVASVPPTVAELYEEVRSCMSVNAYTAAVLASRKLLMNTAVAKGAEPNLGFVAYVDHLAASGYIPPDAKPWVDHIRTKANEATHEIPQVAAADAEELVALVEMLMKLVYELPAKVNARVAKAESGEVAPAEPPDVER